MCRAATAGIVFVMTTYGIHHSEQAMTLLAGDAWVGTAPENCSGGASLEIFSARP